MNSTKEGKKYHCAKCGSKNVDIGRVRIGRPESFYDHGLYYESYKSGWGKIPIRGILCLDCGYIGLAMIQ